jgi:hypothetical protein
MNARRRTPDAASLGRVEYVVESGRAGARETWLVMRADPQAVSGYARMGLDVAAGSRVVVDATSLRPIGVLDEDVPNRPAGFNPYFDPPIMV